MLVVDVDALCKLAHWNVLPLLPELTGYSWKEMGTVSSLSYRAKKAIATPDGKLFRSTDAAKAALDALEKMGEPFEASPTILATLSEVSQIDAGEAVLLATIADDPNGRFLTGDKKALRALSNLGCAFYFSGKILLLEHILKSCLELKGCKWVLENLCPFREVDKAIAMILGSRCDANIENLTAGIHSYINEIAVLHDPCLLADQVCIAQRSLAS